MSKWNFRVIITQINGKREKFAGKDCHEVKSLAGKMFHRDDVQSVCVTDRNGDVYLYLVKDDPKKTINVPSEYAPRLF